MITAFRDTRGQPSVILRCDGCGAEISMRCDMERRRGAQGALRPNAGQVNRKAVNQGWEVRGESHACPSCGGAKRAKTPKKEETMTQTVTEGLRQPTRGQKHEIMAMLQVVYDLTAQRYKGAETDKTVATALGEGIMWGWVSQVREEFFGPDGNEAFDNIMREAAEWMRKADALSGKLHDLHDDVIKTLRDFNDAKAQVAKLIQRASDTPKPRSVAAK